MAKKKDASGAEPAAADVRPELDAFAEALAADPVQPYSKLVVELRKQLTREGVEGDELERQIAVAWLARHEEAARSAASEMARAAAHEADLLAQAELDDRARAEAAQAAQSQAIADASYAVAILADPPDPDSDLVREAQRNLRAQGLSGEARDRAVGETWLARKK